MKTVTIQIMVGLFAIVTADAMLWLFYPARLHDAPIAYEQNIPGVKRHVMYGAIQYGFRSMSMQREERDLDTVRVLCIGASTTDQQNQNTEDTWCAHLERMLNKESGLGTMRIETASFGRGGWKAVDLYMWAERRAFSA